MNFGEKGILEKQGTVTSKATKNKGKLKILSLKIFLFVTIIGIISTCIYGFGLAKKVIDDAPKITKDDVKPNKYPSVIVDSNGNKLQNFTGTSANRVYVSMKDITKDTRNAFVAIEDNRFYEHNGIDPQGIVRAFVVGLTSGGFTEGASTITQQLLKNSTFDFMKEKTFTDRIQRKLQELYLAVKLEKKLSKKQILEYYLNEINLGEGCYGIETAARRYFNKSAKDLTLSETSVIAGITKNPTGYDPIVFPEENAKRRKHVLKNMVQYGYIKQEQMDEALKDNVYERIQQVNTQYQNSTESVNSFFVDALSAQVVSDLQEQLGYSEKQAYTKLYSGGLTITATQDAGVQQVIDEEMNNPANYPVGTKVLLDEYALTVTNKKGEIVNHDKAELLNYLQSGYGPDFQLLYPSEEAAQADLDQFKAALQIPGDATVVENKAFSPQPQASIVVLDQYTGEVKGICGGRGPKTVSMSFNRATDSPRQPGSCFKILSTYAPAIDIDKYTLQTQILDEPFKYEDGTPVKNWYGGYWGTVNVRKAIEQSMNICAVKTLTDITPRVGYEYLLKFGFTTLVDNEEGSDGKIYTDVLRTLALGGMTKGVKNIEMTAAYASLANNGKYIKPRFYTKIVDHDGKVVIDNTPQTRQVVKDSTAGLLTDAMKGVVTRGTGTAASFGPMPISGKTGTTTTTDSDDKDIWFSAYTPYYTCSVWGGYDVNYPLVDTGWHIKLWRAVMSRIHTNLPVKDFTMPASVKKMTMCADTGMLPNSGCPIYTDFFAVNDKSKQQCTKHKGYPLNVNNNSNNSGYNQYYEYYDYSDYSGYEEETGDESQNQEQQEQQQPQAPQPIAPDPISPDAYD